MALCQMSDLFLDPEDSDLQVKVETEKVGESLTIPGHSLVFRRASKVFQVMLDKSKFKEGLTKDVELQCHGDISDALCFIRYLYSKNLEQRDLDSYLAIMQTAHLYAVCDLLETCEGMVQELISPYTVCKICTTVGELASETFLKHCYDMLFKSAFLIFANNLHLSLKEETMEILLKSDNLNALDEEQVLAGLWNWGSFKFRLGNNNTEINIKGSISNLLPFVRWSLIRNVPKKEALLTLYKENIHQGTNSARTVSRTLSLSKFANVIAILHESTKVDNCILMATGIHTILIRIVLKQDVYMSGFQIYLLSPVASFTELPFKIFLNCEDVTDSVHWKEVTVSKSPYSTSSCMRRITIEFLTSVHVSPSNVFCISAVALVPNVYLPSYEVISSLQQQQAAAETCKDLMSFVYEKVNGITDLLYFQ